MYLWLSKEIQTLLCADASLKRGALNAALSYERAAKKKTGCSDSIAAYQIGSYNTWTQNRTEPDAAGAMPAP